MLVGLIAACGVIAAGCRHAAPPGGRPVTAAAPASGGSGAAPSIPPPTGDDVLVQPAVYHAAAFDAGAYVEPTFKANVNDYAATPGFANVRNWRLFSAGFDAEEIDKLKSNLFLVLEGNRHEMSYIYEENDYKAIGSDPWIPSFITTDAVLHTYHVFYDHLVRSLETDALAASASSMTLSLLEDACAQYKNSADQDLKRAALRNIAYLLVPARALQCRTSGMAIPDEAEAIAAGEWKRVDAHAGQETSPLLGYKLDYSQFVPRGHYTRSEALKRYFIAMIWYGAVPILIRDKDGDVLPDGFRQAALLGELFTTTAPHGLATIKLWKRIMDATAFLVGNSDDFTPAQLLAAAAPASKDQRPELAASDSALLNAMIAAAEVASPARIVNGARAREIGVKLMGQRFVLDGYIMQNLVSPYVGTEDKPRSNPMGLDVMATIGGSDRARDLLVTHYNQKQFANYEPQLAKLKKYADTLDPGMWTENAYYGWLGVLRHVTDTKGAGYPPFMRNDAWIDKSLNTALASWAELRHDTILYAKQSNAAEAGGDEDEPKDLPPGGYVEPDIRTYARLRHLLNQVSTGTKALGGLDGDTEQHIKEFGSLLDMLIDVSRKELDNQALTTYEDNSLCSFGLKMESLNTFYTEVKEQRNGQTFTDNVLDLDHDMAVIADVHTDPLHSTALEEGIGHANVIYVVFPAKGKLWIGRGSVLSYREFEQPISNRLTDEAWRTMLKSEKAFGQPDWITSYQLLKPAPRGAEAVDDSVLDESRK